MNPYDRTGPGTGGCPPHGWAENHPRATAERTQGLVTAEPEPVVIDPPSTPEPQKQAAAAKAKTETVTE